jgi:transcriptional regulator with XRE-family HTH domain
VNTKSDDGQTWKVVLYLGRIRQNKGISRADIARRLQVSKSKIDRMEQGRQHLPITDFMAYCQALDLCPAQVIQQLAQIDTTAPPQPRPPQETRRGICERYGLRKRKKKMNWMWLSPAAGSSGQCKSTLWRVPIASPKSAEKLAEK